MKKILVINTKYQITGGEDSNIVDEIKFLQKYYEVEYLEFNILLSREISSSLIM